jgi:hypothetical protein
MIVEIDDNTLNGLARENLVSPDSIRPFKGLAIAENYSKSHLESVVKNILLAIDEGYADPLETHILGKAMVAMGQSLEKSTKDAATMKATQDGRKGTFKGCEFQVKNEATYYDYEKDPIYAELKERLSARQELLKTTAKINSIVVDEVTGEEIPKVPVKSGGGETISISFK